MDLLNLESLCILYVWETIMTIKCVDDSGFANSKSIRPSTGYYTEEKKEMGFSPIPLQSRLQWKFFFISLGVEGWWGGGILSSNSVFLSSNIYLCSKVELGSGKQVTLQFGKVENRLECCFKKQQRY